MASQVLADRVLRDIDTHFSKQHEISDHAYRRIRSKLIECDALLRERQQAASQPEHALQGGSASPKGGRR